MISYNILDSKYYGCPQSRQRVFLVCSKTKRYLFNNRREGLVPVSSIIDDTENKYLDYASKYLLQPCNSTKGMMSHKLINKKKTKKGGRQGERVYSINNCGPTICASSGGPGGKLDCII